MAPRPLVTQFQAHLDEFRISLEPSALNYLTSMLAVMSMSDNAKDIRDTTEIFLEDADVDPEKISQFYATFAMTSSGCTHSFHAHCESGSHN